jgi:hypothetical protein
MVEVFPERSVEDCASSGARPFKAPQYSYTASLGYSEHWGETTLRMLYAEIQQIPTRKRTASAVCHVCLREFLCVEIRY